MEILFSNYISTSESCADSPPPSKRSNLDFQDLINHLNSSIGGPPTLEGPYSLALNAPHMMSEVNGNNNKVLFVLDMRCLES